MMPQTRTTNPRTLLVAAALALGTAINTLALVWTQSAHPQLNADFKAFWSSQRFAASEPILKFYDAQTVRAFQQALFPGFDSFYPYTYPPDFLLVTRWMRDIPMQQAESIWTVAGLLTLIFAATSLFRGPHRWVCVLALLASPAALLNLALGQTAYFTTALLLAGLAALPRRPVLAGLAFGLLTLKPQLGLLIPILLLARRDWRAILAATLTALALIALSCALYPARLWPLWVRSLGAYQRDYFASHGLNLNIIITPAANLISLGAGPAIAWVGQCACTLIIAALVYRIAQTGPYCLAAAALLTGGFLAVPHAYAYDSIPIAAALALIYRPSMPPWQVILGAVLYLGPLLLLTPATPYFLYSIPEAMLFTLIITLARPGPNGASWEDEPDDRPVHQH